MLVFWGCEGQSEISYAAFLNELFERASIPVRLKAFDLGGAGSVAVKIYKATKILRSERSKGSKFKQKFVMMDIDRAESDPIEKSKADIEARNSKIGVLWQRPCFEGFLIKHFEEIRDRNPPNCKVAEAVLKTVWADYDKPETARRLTKRLQFDPHIKSLLTVESQFKRVFEGFGLKLN